MISALQPFVQTHRHFDLSAPYQEHRSSYRPYHPYRSFHPADLFVPDPSFADPAPADLCSLGPVSVDPDFAGLVPVFADLAFADPVFAGLVLVFAHPS